jgi:hypothetical protein
MKKSARKVTLAALGLAILGFVYGFLWLIQTASLSGAPNYSIERAHYNANGAYAVMTVSILVVTIASILLWRHRKE